MTTIVCISDTHGLHGNIAYGSKLPKGDVLVCTGDICRQGTGREVEKFCPWLGKQDYKYKIVIPGNHDIFMESHPERVRSMIEAAGGIYLCDEGITINGLHFYGSPWSSEIENASREWAFTIPSEFPSVINEYWEKIPTNTDVLLTHTPPYKTLDSFKRYGKTHHVGCPYLVSALERIKPKLHVFGHIHDSYGKCERDGMISVNASICNEDDRHVNKPIVVQI